METLAMILLKLGIVTFGDFIAAVMALVGVACVVPSIRHKLGIGNNHNLHLYATKGDLDKLDGKLDAFMQRVTDWMNGYNRGFDKGYDKADEMHNRRKEDQK